MSSHLVFDKYSRAYFEGFVLSLLIAFLPFKVLVYFVPFFFMLWFILRADSGKTLVKFLLTIFGLILVTVLYKFFYVINGENFLIQNSLLTIITYSSLIIFFLISNIKLSNDFFYKYMAVLKWFILIQSSIGIIQVTIFSALNGGSFDLATGDIAQGTLNLFSFIDAGGNFNNQIYSNNLLVLLLFYLPFCIEYKKGYWVCLIGFTAVLIASVWHLLIAFFASSFILTFLFSRSFIKISATRLILIVVFTISTLIVASVQPKNFSLISYYFNKITTADSPKALVTLRSIQDLPEDYPWVYYIGLGPGQYTSRASLIGTGKYFGEFTKPKKIPLLKPASSDAFEKYIYPKWREVSLNPETYGNSTMARPFYSILSVLIEFGFIVFIVILILLSIILFRLKSKYRKALRDNQKLRAFYLLSCGVAICYLAAISIFENYLEVSQAIFVPLLLIRYFLTTSKSLTNYQEEQN